MVGNCCFSVRAKTEGTSMVPIHGGPIIARKHERLVFASGKLDRGPLAGIHCVAICKNILKR